MVSLVYSYTLKGVAKQQTDCILSPFMPNNSNYKLLMFLVVLTISLSLPLPHRQLSVNRRSR